MSYFKPEPKKSLFFNLKKNPPTRRSSIFTLAQAAHSIEFTTTKDFHLESHSKSFFFLQQLGVHRVQLEVCDRKAAVRRPRTRFDLSHSRAIPP